MREQVAHGDLRVGLRVLQLEVRQVFFRRVVERELALVGAIATSIAVNAFEEEPMAKSVSGVTGSFRSKSLRPRPFM